MVYHIVVKEKVLQQDLYYKKHLIMSYTIKYPLFLSAKFQIILSKLNSYYKTRALMYEKSEIRKLYQVAMAEYEYSVSKGFPVRVFEAYEDFNVTVTDKNMFCKDEVADILGNNMISLYFDKYEYSGGAHGLTVRYSDTWDLERSRRIELCDLFPDIENCREYIISIIIKQIEDEINQESKLYFDDYAVRVYDSFRMNNFFITKEGVVSYFQQYDIAPYAMGIPEFFIKKI